MVVFETREQAQFVVDNMKMPDRVQLVKSEVREVAVKA